MGGPSLTKGRQEKILLKAEDEGACAVPCRHFDTW